MAFSSRGCPCNGTSATRLAFMWTRDIGYLYCDTER